MTNCVNGWGGEGQSFISAVWRWGGVSESVYGLEMKEHAVVVDMDKETNPGKIVISQTQIVISIMSNVSQKV